MQCAAAGADAAEEIAAADALIEYAADNGVDHLIMGARGVTGMRRILGSVSARVVAEAPCTVTVVRAAVPSE